MTRRLRHSRGRRRGLRRSRWRAAAAPTTEGEGLPPEAAAILDERLDEIAASLRGRAPTAGNAGACDDIQNDSFTAIADAIDSLPDDVDPDMRDAPRARASTACQDLDASEGCADTDEQPDRDRDHAPGDHARGDRARETTPPEQTETQPAPEQPDGGAGDEERRRQRRRNRPADGPAAAAAEAPGGDG